MALHCSLNEIVCSLTRDATQTQHTAIMYRKSSSSSTTTATVVAILPLLLCVSSVILSASVAVHAAEAVRPRENTIQGLHPSGVGNVIEPPLHIPAHIQQQVTILPHTTTTATAKLLSPP